MNGRFFLRIVAVFLLIAVAAGLASVAYNVGLNVGLNVAAQQIVEGGQPVTVVPYGYPYGHGGFGFFGIIFWIIGFFLIIGLLRAAFGFGRWGRGGGWDKSSHGPLDSHSGWGYGGRGEAIADWHRELHRREESAETNKGTAPSTTGS